MSREYIIAIPIYPGVDLMDVAAPYEVFNWIGTRWNSRAVKVYLVAESLAPVKTRDGLEMIPHRTFQMPEEVNLLWVPGGNPNDLVVQMGKRVYVDFIQRSSRTADFVSSVCEGALIAAYAGLLHGYEATTHWAFVECLRKHYPR